MKDIIVVVGPTAIGKSKLAIELAKHYQGVVINADAMQVYKGLDIATAKVTAQEMEGIPHYLLDICEPSERFSVFEFKQKCMELIEYFQRCDQQIILIGGSGLYLKALIYDYPLDEDNHTDLSQYDQYTNEQLYSMLQELDLQSALILHPNNRQRVLRALAMAHTDQTKTQRLSKQSLLPVLAVKVIGLNCPREMLYQRINERVDVMVADGLVQEAEMMYHLASDSSLTAHQIIGYKEFYPYFRNEITLDAALDKVKQHSRNLAKKQMTWFNNQMAVNWFEVDWQDFNHTLNNVISKLEEK